MIFPNVWIIDVNLSSKRNHNLGTDKASRQGAGRISVRAKGEDPPG